MTILDSAELLLQARNYSGSGDWLDESGNGHDAQFGTGTPGTNDPQFLPWDGENYLHLPQVAGNYVVTPLINVLPADDAHGEQSIGGWGTQGTNTIEIVTDTDDSLVHPFFGQGGFTKVFKVTYQDDQDLADLTLPTLTAAGHILITSVWFPSNWDGGNVTIDDNGTFGSETGVSNQDAVGATTESWQTMWRKFTPDAGDLDGTLTFASASAPTAGRVMYFAFNTVRADQVETQVASYNIVGSLDVRTKLASTDWTTTHQDVIDTRDGADGYLLRIGPTGDITFSYGNGIVNRQVDSSDMGLTDGDTHELRATFAVSSGDVVYYLDESGFDTDSLPSGAGSPSSLDLTIGIESGNRTSWPFGGGVEWAEVRDGINGPVVVRYDAADATEPFATQTGATDGRTWTYNRSGSGTYLVDQPAFGLHTDDYFEIADAAGLDFAADEALTVMVLVRSLLGGDVVFVGKKDDLTTSAGWSLYRSTSTARFLIGDGSADDFDQISPIAARIQATVAGVRNISDDDIEAFLDGTGSGSPTADSTSLTLANALPVRIGATSDTAASFFNGEIMAHVLWRSALTDAQIVEAGNELLGLFERTVTDAVGITDAVAAAKTINVIITDSIGIADATAPVKTIPATITDSIGLTDTTVPVKTIPVIVIDSIGITDTTTPIKTVSIVITDAVGIGDATDFTKTILIVVVDSIGIIDTVTRVADARRTVTETLGITDETLRAVTISRTITDALGITDDASGAITTVVTGFWVVDPVASVAAQVDHTRLGPTS